MVDEDDVWGYCLSFIQDVEVPELMFLGTEFGLYVSVDAGKNWDKWTHGYPTVSTMDMKIHPREADLVIGTFGRSAFVLDDIRPLRAIAKDGVEILEDELTLFVPPTAVLARYRQPAGGRFVADGAFRGENRGVRCKNYVRCFPTAEGHHPGKRRGARVCRWKRYCNGGHLRSGRKSHQDLISEAGYRLKSDHLVPRPERSRSA